MSMQERRLQALRELITEIEPARALQLQGQGAALIDIREPDEIARGSPAEALRLGRAFLELRIENAAPDTERTLLIMCSGGIRSLFAADSLQRLGYRDVRSVAGGFNRWRNEGLPFEIPKLLDADARERYSRHLLMPEVGEEGQLRLLNSKVLLIGAGGLGSPAALYLAAAGVGTLGVMDHDIVDRSNLQRQILHADDRVGTPKVNSARQAISALNPLVNVIALDGRLSSDNVENTFGDFDVIVDGSDNFPTRYLINDACVKMRIPNVHGSVYRFQGQVAVFWPSYPKRRGPCYRCLFPAPPPPELAPSCAEAGVLGALAGVIGVLQAVETLKVLLAIGDPLVGRLLCYDALQGRFSELGVEHDPDCLCCGENVSFPVYSSHEGYCSV